MQMHRITRILMSPAPNSIIFCACSCLPNSPVQLEIWESFPLDLCSGTWGRTSSKQYRYPSLSGKRVAHNTSHPCSLCIKSQKSSLTNKSYLPDFTKTKPKFIVKGFEPCKHPYSRRRLSRDINGSSESCVLWRVNTLTGRVPQP